MIREAELFVMAEQVLVEVIGRIRHEHWRIVVPAMFDMPGADLALRMKPLVNHYAYDNSWVPDLLPGRTMEDVGKDRFDGDLLGSDPAAAVSRISGLACAAAAEVTDGDAVVGAQLTVRAGRGSRSRMATRPKADRRNPAALAVRCRRRPRGARR
jgi:hypothetical protein